MFMRTLPLLCLALPACGGIGLGGGGSLADENLPPPLLATARCVDAVAAETGRNRRGIVVMQSATFDEPVTLLQVAGQEMPWTCRTDGEAQVTSLIAPVSA